jgi:ABC-type branched-subunit amino acid transport system substrate-binding protein
MFPAAMSPAAMFPAARHPAARPAPAGRLRRIRRTITVLLATLVIPGCAAPNTAPDRLTPLPTAPAPPGGPLTVLVWGSSTDTGNLPYQELTVITRAFTDSVNASGGVNGRVLSVVTCDDHGDADGAQACARQAVEQRVSAVIGGYDAHTERALPILAAAGIAFLETAEPAGAGVRSPIAFPIVGGIPVQVLGAAMLAAAHRCSRVAVLTEDGLYPGSLDGLTAAGLAGSAAVVAGTYRVTGVLGDLDPTLAEATRAGDCLLVAAGTQTTGRIIGAVAAHRYPHQVFMIGAGNPGRVAARYPDLGRQVLAADPLPPVSDPVWRPFRDALASNPDGWTVESDGEAQRASWAAFEVFLLIGRRTITFDANSVLTTLRATSALDTGGLLPPLSFDRASPVPGMPRLANLSVTVQGFPDGQLARLRPGFTSVEAALATAAGPPDRPAR